MADPLLRVRGLTVTDGRGAAIVDAVDLDVGSCEVVGLLGESGSGKSTLAAALTGLLPDGLTLRSGSVRFRARELTEASESELRELRGREIASLFQEPALALNPVLSVGTQIEEVWRAHHPERRGAARRRALELLGELGLGDAARVHAARPHQLSGGQRQRAAIAQALCCAPALLIADEPTTALDPVTQAEILDLLGSLRRDQRLAILLISHDVAELARLADRIVVLYAGEVIEQAPAAELIHAPRHPYARALLSCLARRADGSGFVAIPGRAPEPGARPDGCAFEPRCAERFEDCARTRPPLVAAGEARARCLLLNDG